MLLRSTLVLCAVISLSYADDLPKWGYEGEEAPEFWPDTYPDCGGDVQSPIDIKTADAVHTTYPGLNFVGYDVIPTTSTLTNNGHTAVLTMDVVAEVSGGALGDDTYVLELMHFHWGRDDGQGSEHEIDGVQHAMELHMGHYNKKYGDFVSSVPYDDGLAVLAFFFEVGDTDNDAYRWIVEALGSISAADESTTLALNNPLSAYIPSNATKFYTYRGSVTTPPCTQNVTWTVFTDPISISMTQMEEFRTLSSYDLLPLDHNFRPVQALNGRDVYHNGGQ